MIDINCGTTRQNKLAYMVGCIGFLDSLDISFKSVEFMRSQMQRKWSWDNLNEIQVKSFISAVLHLLGQLIFAK